MFAYPAAAEPGWKKKHPELDKVLSDLTADETAGLPTGGKKWIRRSLRKLQHALSDKTYVLCPQTIKRLLIKQDIRPKANVKRLVKKAHPDRDRQFVYITAQKDAALAAGWPVISVDTKDKVLIGPYKNKGTHWCRRPESVYMHDFLSDAVGKAVPYGIYDITQNQGHIYVSDSAETPEMAVDAITHWWQTIGQDLYPDAPELLILADGGGANGYRTRRWKQQLQSQLVDPYNLTVTVCHYAPGASKWNPVEHRLFSEVSKTWAGTPLTSFECMMDCIEETKTETGLSVQAIRMHKLYEKGLTVTNEEMESLAIEKHATCPNWNYTIRPRESESYF